MEMKKYLACVAASEKTWKNLSTYLFRANFLKYRESFDLAVALNGNNSDAVNFIKTINPEYFFIRENRGFDQAALDHIIKNTPQYEFYIFLHDDHWFFYSNWFEIIEQLFEKYPDVDAWGNLSIFDKQFYADDDSKHLLKLLGYEEYINKDWQFIVMGLAGFYRGKVIKWLLENKGIPHIKNDDYNYTHIVERLFTCVLVNNNYNISQIPPGYEEFLRHKNHYEKNKFTDEIKKLIKEKRIAEANSKIAETEKLFPRDVGIYLAIGPAFYKNGFIKELDSLSKLSK